CDTARSRCVPCLPDPPEKDNCPVGTYCVAMGDSFSCTRGCRKDADCAGGPGMYCDNNHHCVACLMDDHCPPGSVCMAGGCVPGSTDRHGCGGGITIGCCTGRCVDLLGDGMNCGACGRSCGPGTSCCDGACRDLTADIENCGACRSRCPAPP